MSRPFVLCLGLLVCLLFSRSVRADDFGRCTDAGYLGHFDARVAAQPCDVIETADIHWRGGSAKLRAVHPHGMPITGSPALAGRIRELAAAVGTAIDRMGGGVRLDNVTILFTNYVSPREGSPDSGFDKGAYTAGASSIFAHECPVSYYKETHRAGGDDVVFVLAHEIFHCIQYRNWSRMPEQPWLTEASAEYFAYLAKPVFGAGYIPNFDATIRTTALPRMSYEAVVWYLWLGDTAGPARVKDFIAGARSAETAISPSQWGDFAEAYFDRRIRMPDGRAMPSTPQLGGAIAIHGSDHLRMPPVVPFTIGNAAFAFDRGKYYQLRHAPLPPDARHVWRKDEGGAWGPPLTEVSTCSGPVRYRALWATTRSTSLGDIVVTAQPADASVCSCPAGTWQETGDSLRHYFEQSAVSPTNHPRYISGTRLLRLSPDHTGFLSYQDVVTESHGAADFWLRQTKTGTSHFTWRVVGGRLLTTLTAGDNLLRLHNEQHTPKGVLVEDRRAAMQTIGHEFRCESGLLRLIQSPMPSVPGLPPELQRALHTAANVDMTFSRADAAH